MRALMLTFLVAASLFAPACSVRPLETPSPPAPGPDGGGGPTSSGPAPCSALGQVACEARSDCHSVYSVNAGDGIDLRCEPVAFVRCADEQLVACAASYQCSWDVLCCPDGFVLTSNNADCSHSCIPSRYCIYPD